MRTVQIKYILQNCCLEKSIFLTIGTDRSVPYGVDFFSVSSVEQLCRIGRVTGLNHDEVVYVIRCKTEYNHNEVMYVINTKDCVIHL